MKNLFTLMCAALFSCYAFTVSADEPTEKEGTEVVVNADEACGCPKPKEGSGIL